MILSQTQQPDQYVDHLELHAATGIPEPGSAAPEKNFSGAAEW